MTSRLPFTRDSTSRVFGGVCSGLGKRIAVDPILIRLGFVAIAFVTEGWGLLVYLALWLALPFENGTGRRSKAVVIPALATMIALAFFGWVIWMPLDRVVMGLITTGALVILWVVGTRPHASAPPPSGMYAWHNSPLTSATLPPSRRSHWAPYAITTTSVLGLWIVIAIAMFNGAYLSASVWPASALLVIAIALIILSRPRRRYGGRPRALIVAGSVFSVATLMLLTPESSQTALPPPQSTPPTLSSRNTYSLQTGYQTIDLSTITLTENRTITVAQETGRLTLKIPRNVRTVVQSSVAVGEIKSVGAYRSGMDNSLSQVFNEDAPGPTLTVIVSVDAGRLEVVR